MGGAIQSRVNDDESNICACCGYPAPLKEYRTLVPNAPGDTREAHRFCEVCAGTFLSHCITYAGLYGSERHLWGSIGWIANRLLEEIRSTRQGGSKP